MMKYFSLLSAVILLAACGGSSSSSSSAKKNGLTKETKADYQLNQAAIDSFGRLENDAARVNYEGKVIEIKGFVKKPEGRQSSVDPNDFSFYLCLNPDDETGTICYTDKDPKDLAGKQVTVKGKFDYAGVVTLDDCVMY